MSTKKQGQSPQDFNDQPLSTVDFQRVATTMEGFGIELYPAESGDMGTANLNGTPVTFALLSSVLIIRADLPTEETTADGDPTLHLACNQVNSHTFAAKAAVVDRGEKLILRSEHDILIAAGMTDAQLRDNLQESVDAVLAAQTAVQQAAAGIRSAAPAED
ncbi:YbjN domain-containing protein [Corynebacterium sp. A21]|uniref:YbjN domain-containing protein n=1 Tax=Corynebacterium sp. A21 TaxID=3457318 RepID=UPI003FD2C6C8